MPSSLANAAHVSPLARGEWRDQVRQVAHLSANPNGRDFVVGDIHGCLNDVWRLLEAVQFNTRRDRLFSVGDLVDVGPDSMACLGLLREPWFFACRGNHEDMLLRHLKNPWACPANEAGWLDAETAGGAKREEFASEWVPRLEALPHVLVVGEGPGRFQLVHAEIIEDGRPVTDARIDAWAFDDPKRAMQRALRGRALLRAHRAGLSVRRAHDPIRCSPIYCGHTIVPAVLQCVQQIYLDRGAFLGYSQLIEANPFTHAGEQHWFQVRDETINFGFEPGLALAEPATGRCWFASTADRQRPSHIVSPVILDTH